MDTSVVTLKNISNNPFPVVYNNYVHGVIHPGMEMHLPKYMADICGKHLVVQVMNERGIEHNNSVKYAEFEKQVFAGLVQGMEPVKKNEFERMQEELARLNPNHLDQITAPPQIPVDVQQTIQNAPLPPAAPQARTTPEAPKLDAAGNQILPETELVPDAPEVPETAAVTDAADDSTPDRPTLYAYAKDVMGMHLEDPKTMKALENMSISQLIDELQYPVK